MAPSIDAHEHTVDFLVIGSGIAGLTYALAASEHGTALLLTKKARAESNTNYAQGGIAGVMSADDSPDLHEQDTLTAGAGLCREDAVRVLVTEGPLRIDDLIALGAKFDTVADSGPGPHLQLGREGGHSRSRIVHAADRTGWECERALLEATKSRAALSILEHHFVLDLALAESGGARRCVGAYALDPTDRRLHLYRASSVLMASGGCGQVYRHTTNPPIATGDGVAMAWRAGAAVANMEFIQFHPTALYHPQGGSFLISEAVRGEGGVLRTRGGETFMERYHPMGDLAPRDIVARAIHAERLRCGDPCVYLDVTHLEAGRLRERFPTIHDRCLELGIDITRQPIPVVPAAHYMCGGIQTDLHGRSSLPGLYACGEAACTGVHGANRLASNSLLEAMVFGRRAAEAALAERGLSPEAPTVPTHLPGRVSDDDADPAEVANLRQQLQSVMNDRVGIVRNDRDLSLALREVRDISAAVERLADIVAAGPDVAELRNLAQIALIIVRSALTRKESRGLHYTTDYPERDDTHWKHDTVLKLGDEL